MLKSVNNASFTAKIKVTSKRLRDVRAYVDGRKIATKAIRSFSTKVSTKKLRSAARRRVHDVVSVRRTTSEIDTATRITMIAAARKPVIVAVNGPAIGVGATMTLPADVRIAAESARFGFVFARRGIVPEAASSWFLPRVVGISQAMEWVATGRVFGAQEARDGGLVSRVVPDAELLPAAYALAKEIVENTSAVSVAVSRKLLWSMLGASSPWEAHRLDTRAIYELGQGPDTAEGVRSFLEKRPPKFTGRIDDFAAILPEWPQRPEDMA